MKETKRTLQKAQQLGRKRQSPFSIHSFTRVHHQFICGSRDLMPIAHFSA